MFKFPTTPTELAAGSNVSVNTVYRSLRKFHVLPHDLSENEDVAWLIYASLSTNNLSEFYGHYINLKRKLPVHTTHNIIKRSIAIHGPKYTYYKLNFINLTTKVIFTCKQHGDFLQSPQSHLAGSEGCKICVRIKKHTHKLHVL